MNFFITENYLKTKTTITANVDVNDVVPIIETSADMSVQPILGTYFYKYLLGKYNAQTLSNNETTLVEFIQPCVAWAVCSDAVLTLSNQLKNKGLQSQNGEFSQATDFKTTAFYVDHYKQKADFYIKRLEKYLRQNKALFPQFTSSDNKDSNIKPNDSNQTFNDSILFV